MEFIKKIYRDRAGSVLFVIGLAISSFILISVMDFVDRIQIEKDGLHQYQYEINFRVSYENSYIVEEEAAIVESMWTYLSSLEKGNLLVESSATLDGTKIYVDTITLVVQNEPMYIDCISEYDVTRENTVLIGENLEKNTFIKNNKKLINLNGLDWEVAGILKNYMSGGIDERVYMFLENFSADYYEKYFRESSVDAACQYLSEEDILSSYEAMQAEMSEASFDVTTFEYDENHYNETYKVFKTAFTVIGISFSVLNCFTVSILWLSSRKNEIGIRKAFGYSTLKLTLLVFKDILVMSILSITLSTIVQAVRSIFGDIDIVNNFGMKIIGVFMGMLFISAIIMLNMIDSIRKMPPVNAINGGGTK